MGGSKIFWPENGGESENFYSGGMAKWGVSVSGGFKFYCGFLEIK